eukprot:7212519-Pyramimonas_sp.AAC.1
MAAPLVLPPLPLPALHPCLPASALHMLMPAHFSSCYVSCASGCPTCSTYGPREHVRRAFPPPVSPDPSNSL